MFKMVCQRLVRVLILSGLALPAAGTARQLDYSQQSTNTDVRLNYRFEAPPTRQSITFSVVLPRKSVRTFARAFRRFNPRDLRRRLAAERTRLTQQALQQLRRRFPDTSLRLQSDGRIAYETSPKPANRQLRNAQTRDIDALLVELRRRYPHIRITYEARAGRVQMSGIRSSAERQELNGLLSSRIRAIEAQAQLRRKRLANQAKNNSQQLSKRLNDAIDQVYVDLNGFETEYLEARYYSFNGHREIQPDYRRIARESLQSIEPVAKAWARSHALPPSRKALNQLLGFFQSIPYDTLESRNSSDGAGFAMPVALLARNRGDCDTKSVAMATTVHALAPEIPIIMVLLEDHALLGFAVDSKRGDATLEFNGRSYVLAEPVGPALTPLGTIGKRSQGRAKQVLQLFDPAARRRG